MPAEAKIINVDYPAVAKSGETVDVTTTVKNDGTEPARLYAELFDADTNTSVNFNSTVTPVNPGESANIVNQFLMPAANFNFFISAGHEVLKMLPVGTVVAWLKNLSGTPALPDGWAECNGQTVDDADSPYYGQTLPNLNGENRFLRGSSSSGNTGGRNDHWHRVEHADEPGEHTRYPHGWVRSSGQGHWCGPENHLPPYYEVVWIIKIK